MAKRDDTTAVTQALGAAIRRQREKLGLSQEEFGFRSGFDRTYISGIERGVRNPTMHVVVRICQSLDIRPSTLFRRAEDATELWD